MSTLKDIQHKTFRGQTNCIGSCNFHANTMHGTQIRGKLDTRIPGTDDVPPGYLQDFDLSGGFVDDAPKYVKNACRHYLDDKKGGWLYTFFHWNKQGKKVTHGWVLFNDDHSEILAMWYENWRWKTMEIVNICSELVRKDAQR